MNLGIVGHAADKFTKHTEASARSKIKETIRRLNATTIISGHCHLGGVDIWAEEIATELNLPTIIHAPKTFSWSGIGGFRDRNLAIVRDSDLVLCVVVESLPDSYSGMRFPMCYHCGDRNPKHVKSGGCWTAWKAKEQAWIII